MFSTDLAFIHDAGFGAFAEGAAPEIVRILRQHGIAAGGSARRHPRIVEVGCGSGTLARRLVDCGYEVVGCDISAAMLRLARSKVPEARFRRQSLTELRVPRCAAVVAIGEVITYVPCASKAGLPLSLRRFFARTHDALEPGGLLIFDFIESAARRTYQAKSKAGPGWVIAAHAELDDAGRTLTRRLVTIRRIGRQFRRSQESHGVRIYPRRAVGDALAAAGFTARMSRAYGRYGLMPGNVAVVACKEGNGRPRL